MRAIRLLFLCLGIFLSLDIGAQAPPAQTPPPKTPEQTAQDACGKDQLSTDCSSACATLPNSQTCKDAHEAVEKHEADTSCQTNQLSSGCQEICAKLSTYSVCQTAKKAYDDAVANADGKCGGVDSVQDVGNSPRSQDCKTACASIAEAAVCVNAEHAREICKEQPNSAACQATVTATIDQSKQDTECAKDATSAACKAAKQKADTSAQDAATKTGFFQLWFQELGTNAEEAEKEGQTEINKVWGPVMSKCQSLKGGLAASTSLGGTPGETVTVNAVYDSDNKLTGYKDKYGNFYKSGDVSSLVNDGGDGDVTYSAKIPMPGTKSNDITARLGYLATKADTNKVLKRGSGESVSLEDRMEAALYMAQPVDSGHGGTLDYQNRGELLVKHPLALPINLIAWCVAVKAQELIPMFCTQAVRLFSILLILEWTWMGINFVLKAGGLGPIIDGLVTKLHLWGFVGSFILTGYYGFTNTNWLYSIFNSFNAIGEIVVTSIYDDMQNNNTDPSGGKLSLSDLSSKHIIVATSGTPASSTTAPGESLPGEALSPGSYFAMGILVLGSLWSKIAFNFDIVSFLLVPLIVFITPIVLVSFAKMVADITMTMLEGYIGMGMLMILMAFGAARWGKDYIQKVLLYGVMMGFKLMCLYCIFMVGVRMMAYISISTWYVQGSSDFIVCVVCMLSITMLLSFVFQRLPQAGGALFGGSPTMSFGQFMKDTMGNAEAGNMALKASSGAISMGAKGLGKATGATKALKGVGSKISAKLGDSKLGKAMMQAKGSSSSSAGGGSKGGKSATKASLSEVKKNYSDIMEDAPSTGNFILPTVSPPGDD